MERFVEFAEFTYWLLTKKKPLPHLTYGTSLAQLSTGGGEECKNAEEEDNGSHDAS